MPSPPNAAAHQPHFHRNEAWKQPVRVATTAAGTLATSFDAGSSVDGVTLATGDRILVKDQADEIENGIYRVEASGAPTRAFDMDDAGEAAGAMVLVLDGSQAGTLWRCTNTGATVLDSEDVIFEAFSGSPPPAGEGIYLNVLDYGATGDGATDDTAAIQDTIDTASAAGGGVVFFPAGHYIVKTDTSGQRYAMTVPSNVSLLGEGYASHIELTSAGNASTVQHVIELGTASTSASYISIRDLRVEANYASLGPAKTIQGIAARQDSDQTQHVDHVLIEGCWVIDSGVGIVCSKDGGSSGSARTANRHLDWTVVGNYIHTTANKAVELQECLGGRIIRNRAFAVEDGYQAINYSERILIADNYVEYDQNGIAVTEGCTDVDVVDNVCYSTAESGTIGAAGIILRREPYTGAVTSYRIRVARNRVTSTHANAILFAFETRTGNTGTSRWEDCEIIDNVFKGTGDSYLYDKASATRSDATGLKVFDNFFIGPALTHASWASDGTRVERNRFNTAHTANSDGWWYEGNKFISTFTVVGSITQGPTNIGPVVVSGAAAAGNVLTASSASAAAWAAPEAPAVASSELLVADGTTGPNGITPTSYVEEEDAHTTTSASLEDIPDVTTTITLQRTSHVAAWLNTQISGSGACVIGIAVNFNGTDHDEMQHAISGSDAAALAVVHRTATELAPGTYTIKGRMRRVSGASTPSVDRADMLVMAMGHSGPVMLTTEAEDDYVYSD